jgi:hypothetical protein
MGVGQAIASSTARANGTAIVIAFATGNAIYPTTGTAAGSASVTAIGQGVIRSVLTASNLVRPDRRTIMVLADTRIHIVWPNVMTNRLRM